MFRPEFKGKARIQIILSTSIVVSNCVSSVGTRNHIQESLFIGQPFHSMLSIDHSLPSLSLIIVSYYYFNVKCL